MTNYKQERNGDKWLAFVVALIVIATIFLTIAGAKMFYNSIEKESYHKGYHDAKLTYESKDFEYNEEKLLND